MWPLGRGRNREGCFSGGEERGEGSARRPKQRGVGPSLPSENLPPRARALRRPSRTFYFQTGRLSLPKVGSTRPAFPRGGGRVYGRRAERGGASCPWRSLDRAGAVPRRVQSSNRPGYPEASDGPGGGGALLRAPGGQPGGARFFFSPKPCPSGASVPFSTKPRRSVLGPSRLRRLPPSGRDVRPRPSLRRPPRSPPGEAGGRGNLVRPHVNGLCPFFGGGLFLQSAQFIAYRPR